jgi:hypothetical protein
MPVTDAVKNAGLDAMVALMSHMSLHSAFSITGANELTGGSPAYARQAITWGAAASGSVSLGGAETFDVPAGATVAFIGTWSAISAGTFRGMWPAQATADSPKPFTAADTGDLFTCDAHGYANADRVVFWDLGAGSVLPTGITEGTIYWVISVSGDTFQVSTTQGGAAVTLTSDGGGQVHKITPEAFAGQGTYQVADLDIPLVGA